MQTLSIPVGRRPAHRRQTSRVISNRNGAHPGTELPAVRNVTYWAERTNLRQVVFYEVPDVGSIRSIMSDGFVVQLEFLRRQIDLRPFNTT